MNYALKNQKFRIKKFLQTVVIFGDFFDFPWHEVIKKASIFINFKILFRSLRAIRTKKSIFLHALDFPSYRHLTKNTHREIDKLFFFIKINKIELYNLHSWQSATNKKKSYDVKKYVQS